MDVRPPVLVGTSAAISNLREEVDCAAKSDIRVLITGESGVGKEIVARMVHERGLRARRPMFTFNCAGLAETLLESELFGHVRGSFTDAYRDKRGLFELASSGTLFMDEVGEMSQRMQGLVLRFLETGEIQPVGSERVQPATVDVRLIAATNRDLLKQVAEKAFRADLFYRLNVIHIQIPPLRERREDIALLLDHFLAHYARAYRVEEPTFSSQAKAMLTEYDWPGNVRELMNVVEQMTVRHAGQIISPLELPREMNSATRAIPGSRPSSHIDPLVLFERIVRDGENFWSVVYEPFMLRDLTREHVRQLVTLGLQHSRGSYRALVALMGLPPTDYKRFLNFLRKHQCQVPFHGWRAAPVPVSVLTERQEEPASEGAPRPAAGGRALGRSA